MSPTAPSLRLTIGSTWDGDPADPVEIAQLELTAAPLGLRIIVHAPFHDDPPPAGPPGALDGLWDFEVVELFIAGAGGRYVEVELGPFGHQLVLSFTAPRERAGGLQELLEYSARRDGPFWRGEALLPYRLLPPGPHRANAFAIHGPAETRRYLAHEPLPGETPDFHQPSRFVTVVLPQSP